MLPSTTSPPRTARQAAVFTAPSHGVADCLATEDLPFSKGGKEHAQNYTSMLASAARRCVAESSPNLSLTANAAFQRKASLNALVGGASPPANRIGADGRDIGVYEKVDVPSVMHGEFKSIGIVNRNKGTFAGVQLSRDYASRRNNNGEMDG